MNQEILPSAYAELLEELKQRIRTARIRAALSVNRGLIRLYWEIGKAILNRQQSARWGDKILDQLATDLRREFPDMQGLSRTNLKYMRMFADGCGRIPPWGGVAGASALNSSHGGAVRGGTTATGSPSGGRGRVVRVDLTIRYRDAAHA
jgi:hypothetical protein